MKNFRLVLAIILMSIFITSCADSKEFIIDGKKVNVEPYGWFDSSKKNDSIEYKVNVGNIVLDVIFCETIIVPIILTGDQLYEPVRKKVVWTEKI